MREPEGYETLPRGYRLRAARGGVWAPPRPISYRVECFYCVYVRVWRDGCCESECTDGTESGRRADREPTETVCLCYVYSKSFQPPESRLHRTAPRTSTDSHTHTLMTYINSDLPPVGDAAL